MARVGFEDFTAQAGTSWTTPGNAATSDDSDATYAGSAQDYLRCTVSGVSIPDNSRIVGFEAIVEARSATSRTIEIGLTKDGTTLVGTAKTQALTATDTKYFVGGSADLWSSVWDIGEINTSTAGIIIRDDTATASDIEIDYVAWRIYYENGLRSEWDVDNDAKEVIHIDSYIDYDGGTGGTAPVDGEVLYTDTGTGLETATILNVAGGSVLADGYLALGEQHGASGAAWADGDSLEICSYVTFDAEGSGGFTEADIGSTFTASVGGTRTGTIRHIRTDGTDGTMWWDATNEGGTAVQNNDTITLDGTARTVTASAGETTNAWTGTVRNAEHTTPQGTLLYDAESTAFESASASGRIRSSDFQHNICVLDTTSNATAMVVFDFEDPNATDTGTLGLIDISGTFGDDNTVIALEEVDYQSEQTPGFAVGDTVGDADAGPTHSWEVRRLIDNGATGTLYLERASGSARFADTDNIFVVGEGAGQEANAVGAQRERVGSATINGTLTTTNVQWPSSHLYTDMMDQFDELIQMDDTTPEDAQVLDQQYTMRNDWLVPFYSTRRLKTGALNELDAQGGADGDSVFTNYFHLGSLATQQNLYVQQGTNNVLEQFWDAGSPTDVLLRNKNKNSNVEGGTVTWYVRPFGELYDFFALSPVGLRNPVPLNTGTDSNNDSTYAAVRDGAVYHAIEIAWASHTLNFDTGAGGTFEVGDVLFNSTRTEGAMVARVPDSFTSGTDLHFAAQGQDVTDWGDGDSLEILDYVDFDGQASQFVLGELIEAGGGGSGGPTVATVRWVQQFGNSRGRVWFSGQAGSDWTDNEVIRLDGGGATRATCSAAQTSRAGWTGLTNTATPETADITALKDIGNGAETGYNVVINLNGATMKQFYEWTKLITEERAGSATDPGALLYPNDASVQGRLYQKADSAFGAGDLSKTAPFGTFAGGKFFGARGVFIENMDSADVQNYELINSAGTTENPPNLQSVVLSGVVVGDTVAAFRRAFTDSVSLTYNDNDGNGDSEITRGSGDFIRDGWTVGQTAAIAGTTSNDSVVPTVKAVAALTLTLDGIVLADEGPVSSDLRGSGINKETYQGAASGNDLGDADFVVQETIASDEPASGTIIVVSTNGSEVYEDIYTYSAFATSTFTINETLVRAYDGTARVYVPLIYKTAAATSESQQIIYSADFPVKGVVRLKGIIPFESNQEFTSTGVTIAAVRQTDTIVE